MCTQRPILRIFFFDRTSRSPRIQWKCASKRRSTHTHTSRHETPSSTYRQTYIAQLGSARFVCLENRGVFIVLVCATATAATTHQSIFIYSLYGLNAVSHSQSQRMFTRMNQFQHTHLICNRKRSKSQMMRSRHILDLVARLKIYRMCLSVCGRAWQGQLKMQRQIDLDIQMTMATERNCSLQTRSRCLHRLFHSRLTHY